MKKTISVRTIAILGLVLVALVYLFVFHLPVKKETEELNNKIADLETQIQTNEAMLIQMNTMKKELEASAEKNVLPLPVYNNSNNIIAEMNTILANASTERYDIDFGEETSKESLVSRNIRINFVATSYEEAKQKLYAIRDSENGYVIKNLNIVEGETDAMTGLTKYSVSVEITAYEYKA